VEGESRGRRYRGEWWCGEYRRDKKLLRTCDSGGDAQKAKRKFCRKSCRNKKQLRRARHVSKSRGQGRRRRRRRTFQRWRGRRTARCSLGRTIVGWPLSFSVAYIYPATHPQIQIQITRSRRNNPFCHTSHPLVAADTCF